jgi:hypothetical protein
MRSTRVSSPTYRMTALARALSCRVLVLAVFGYQPHFMEPERQFALEPWTAEPSDLPNSWWQLKAYVSFDAWHTFAAVMLHVAAFASTVLYAEAKRCYKPAEPSWTGCMSASCAHAAALPAHRIGGTATSTWDLQFSYKRIGAAARHLCMYSDAWRCSYFRMQFAGI